MALFGRRTAVIPLGIGCQTAHQVERAAGVIAELAKEIFIPERTPFEWRIVGAADMERMIAEDEFYPTEAKELHGTKRPYWSRRHCHFWHDPAGSFEAFRSKQEHLRDNWRKITTRDRKIFILSNVQGNLPEKAADPGGFDFRLHTFPVISLAHTLGRVFDKPELHVVTSKDRFDGLDMLAHHASELRGVKLGVHFVKAETGGWHGSDRVWDGTLARIIGETK